MPSELWPSFGSTDELFHLAADPMEQKNLAADAAHAAKLDEMRELLKAALSLHRFTKLGADRKGSINGDAA